jgi:prepilin peptidase CpaA
MLSNTPDTVRLAALSAMLMVALYQDIKSRRIPNTIALAGALTGFGLSVMTSGIGAISSFVGGVVGLLGFGIFYLFRFMGAGDVKLISATGFFVGFPDILQVSLCILFAGGVLSLIWGFMTSQLMPAWMNLRSGWSQSLKKFSAPAASQFQFTPTFERVPYALAIAAGTWLQVISPWSPL